MSSIDRWLPTLISVPLVGFVLYRRLSKAFRRQPIAPRRMILRVSVLSLIGALFLLAIPTAHGFAAAGAGALLGAGLALFGLTRTRLEATAEGRFYTPHKWTELVVMTLFLGRLVGRMLVVLPAASALPSGGPPDPALQKSPLTLALFFLLAAYYAVYYVSLLRRARTLIAPAKAAAA
jgi:hypothetical protein